MVTIEIFWKENRRLYEFMSWILKFRANFHNATDEQLLHEKGKMKNAEVAKDTVILPVYTTMKDLTKGMASETRRKEIRYSWRSGESLSPYASLKFFYGAPKFLARQTPFLHLLTVVKGAIIFHLRYRVPYPLVRLEKTDVATSSQEWKITGDNKFYEEAPFPAESPFRPAIRFSSTKSRIRTEIAGKIRKRFSRTKSECISSRIHFLVRYTCIVSSWGN